MERKALKWETPQLLYLSTDTSHGAANCVTGDNFADSDCTPGSGAQATCNSGISVGPSGVVCFDGLTATVNRR